MAQGTRGRWTRVAATGLGVLLCTGLVGCMNNDKPKDVMKRPTPGLPGTTTLNPGSAGAMSRTGPQGQPYNANGANPQPGSFASPASGLGAGQQRYGTNGQNTLTNTGGVQPAAYTPYGNMPMQNQPGVIGAPAMQGVQPANRSAPFGPVGSATPSSRDSSVAAITPPPTLSNLDPLPPPAPPGFGSAPEPFSPPGVQPPTVAAPSYNTGTAFNAYKQ